MTNKKIEDFISQNSVTSAEKLFLSDYNEILKQRGWKVSKHSYLMAARESEISVYHKNNKTLFIDYEKFENSFLTDYPKEEIERALKEKYETRGMNAFLNILGGGVSLSGLDAFVYAPIKNIVLGVTNPPMLSGLFTHKISEFFYSVIPPVSTIKMDGMDHTICGMGILVLSSFIGGGVAAVINKSIHRKKKKEAISLLESIKKDTRIKGTQSVLEEIL